MAWWTKRSSRSEKADARKNASRDAEQTESVEALLKKLQDPDNDVRCRATYSLWKSADPAAIDGLLVALKDSYWDVRRMAALALGEFGDPRAIPGLVGCLNDQEFADAHMLRRQIAESLVKLRAISALEAALSDADVRVRRIAAEGLESLGKEPVGDADRVLRAVALQRWDAAAGLGETAIERLAEVLNDENIEAAQGAAKALAKIQSDRVVLPLVRALDDPRDSIQKAVTWALARTGNDEALEALVAALSRTDDSDVSKTIVNAIAEFRERALAPLLALLRSGQKCGNTSLFMDLPKALAALGPSVVKDLLAELSDPDPAVRATVCRALGYINDQAVVSPLIGLLSDSRTEVRIEALGSLRRLQSRASVLHVLPLLGDPDKSIRLAAIEALWDIGDPQAGEKLIPMLQDPEPSVRWYAAKALGILGEATALASLCDALSDSEPLVRTLAAEALGKLKDARALAPLEQALEKYRLTDGHFRRAAEAAINVMPRRPELAKASSPGEAGTGGWEALVSRLVEFYRAQPEGFVKGGGHPSEQRIREIGEALNQTGGMDLMRTVHREFASRTSDILGAGRNLEFLWDGIGDWRG